MYWYWWRLPRTWQVWLAARKARVKKRWLWSYHYLYLSRSHYVRLQTGYRFEFMCVGPYLCTDDDGMVYVGIGLGPLFAEVAWNVGSEGRLARLLWGKDS